VIVYGFIQARPRSSCKLFVPSGVPGLRVALRGGDRGGVVPLAPDLASRVRLFANMLAGHIALKVFAGFFVTLGLASAGVVGWLGATAAAGS
jgi:F-type H+-transporting ATPase subunit a